ncbi:MAG: hypothetical protein AAGJ12_00465, partial [Bacteroidota bacterium]
DMLPDIISESERVLTEGLEIYSDPEYEYPERYLERTKKIIEDMKKLREEIDESIKNDWG